MEEPTPELHRPNDDEGSLSPDSGLCPDLDVKPPKRECLLSPQLHDRRLTLLKSLSQDSEYSLDTSLFDAEEFLQDMGFAGCRDPTIPDRFLPSLMQRLSRFPESEMESLHDRIIQSIGCFRRKEGKRRLFRNMSMGKDPHGWHLLGCPSTSHPLLRSNTDPSTFPYEETSSATSSSSLLQSSNSSRLQSLGSSKDESEFPESPIAILVSAASVDQDRLEVSIDHNQRHTSEENDQRKVSKDHDQRGVNGDHDQRDVSEENDQRKITKDHDQRGVGRGQYQRDVSEDHHHCKVSEDYDPHEISVEQHQQEVSSDHDEGLFIGELGEICFSDAASQVDLDGGDEFANTVEGIRKLTKKISVQDDDDISQLDNDEYQPEDDVSQSYDDVSQSFEGVFPYDDDSLFDEDASQFDEKGGDVSKRNDKADGIVSGFDVNVSQPKNDASLPDCQPDNICKPDVDVSFNENNISQTDVERNLNGLLVQKNQAILCTENNHLNEAKQLELFDGSSFSISGTDVTHNYNSSTSINSGVLNKDLSYITNINRNVSESIVSNGTSSNTKTPLRRTSNAMFYNTKSLRGISNPQFEKEVDNDGSENNVQESFGIKNRQYSIEKEDSNVKLNELERVLNGDTIIKDSAKLNENTQLKCLQTESSINAFQFQTTLRNNCNKLIKPKYSRDNSLTNFLSSMLDTSDIAVTRPSAPIPNPFSEKICNSDSEIAGSFASSPYIAFGASDAKSKSHSSGIPKIIQTTFLPTKKESIEKAPNRKRRVLRRMSSSLQCDDVTCNDSNGLKMDCFSGDVKKSAMTSFQDTNPLPKLNHGSFKPVSPSHRTVHSCSSLPVRNSPRACNGSRGNDEINENVIDSQSQIPRQCCVECDTKREGNMAYFRKCKRRRNLSCPFPELSLNHSARFKPNAVQCVCRAYTHTPHSTENNTHSSLVFPSNLPQKDICSSCRCFYKSSNYRLNSCSASSPSSIFNSPNTENCDLNVRCIGPPSPFLQPNNDVFAFGPNLWNQNRHLCYSSPDLREECCSSQSDYCQRKSFTNVDECSFNSCEKCAPQPFRGGINYSDEVFLKDNCRCCKFRNKYSEFVQETTKNKISIRAPQRQNSISIADSEIPTQNLISDNKILPVSCSINKNLVKEPLTVSTISNICLPKGDRNNGYSSPFVPKASNLLDSLPLNNFRSDPKPPETPLKTETEETNEISPKSPSSPPTKSEALLERKIRIFSKFLANLGNLSKSAADTDIDNKHKRIPRDQKPSDVPSSDKKTKSRAFRVSCPVYQSKKDSADFDRLLSLLKSMELNTSKSSETVKALNEKCEISEPCKEKLHENNCPVYENKVILQANDIIGVDQHRTYKPVLYSSSVHLYINSEDKMDTQKDRNEKADSCSDEDKEKREAPTEKEKYYSDRSSSQVSFRGVSKEIEDLQLSIQKAKEMRMCASKELHLLQELLSMDVMDENTTKEKMSTDDDFHRWEQEVVSADTDVKPNQALADLREKSKKEILEDSSFWKEEIQKVREETKQAWQSKLDRMEARLLAQEEELRRLQSDNSSLHRQADPCRTTENGRTDSAFEDDEEQPSTPIPSSRQECDRLQQRLLEEEQRADQLNLMLNQKLIELNKIQITLSKQTKEMIELEKSYLQLQCRLRRGTSKPVVSRLCSRSSPFSPKNLCPKPSPPASPQPTNGTS